MQQTSELHIIVPGICGPLAETQFLKSSEVVERWIKTLSKAHCSSVSGLPCQGLSAQGLSSPGNTEDVIASIFDIKFDSDFPSAALTLLANDQYDPAMFYMHADPVHLQADMDQAVLTSSTDLEITESESLALCGMLNQHFSQDGLTFISINKDQWFVSSPAEIQMKTTSLVDATGRNINFILPDGKDAVRWKQVLTEAQMLMHAHELNALRDDSGLLTINSLWFHGSGTLAGLINDQVINVCSDHDVLKGLASHMGYQYLKVPDSVDVYAVYLLSCKHGSVNVFHLAELEHLVNYTDVRPWSKALAKVLDGWIYPLINIANKNNIKVTLYPCNEKKYQFSKYDILKFWRKAELEKHVNSY